MENIFVFGASGHAKVVISIIERVNKYLIKYLIDDDLSLKGSVLGSHQVIGDKKELLTKRITRNHRNW